MISHLRNQRPLFGRALALLALLAVLGGQVLETQHTHSASEQAAECLLCQGSADALTPCPEPVNGFGQVAGIVTVDLPADNPVAPTYSYTARGPPLNT